MSNLFPILPHPPIPTGLKGSHYLLLSNMLFQIISMILSASPLLFLPFACYASDRIYIYFPAPC